jgi:DNA-binding phage protein
MNAGGVLPKRAPLGKETAKEALALVLARLVHRHGVATVAAHAGCCDRTIRSAMGLDSLPELHTVLNLLSLDATALDELLAPMGFRLVQVEDASRCYPTLLADLAGVTATTAAALADGRVDHQEDAKIVSQLRELLPVLNAFMATKDTLRVAA